MFPSLSFTWIFPWEGPNMFLRSRECELESHQPPVATSRQRLGWRGGLGCDTGDWWCCTTAATGEKRHWRRRYQHRFDVGITTDVFHCSFDTIFPPFWHCLVVWKDVVFRYTSGVVCGAVPGTLQALFAVSLRCHTRHRLQYHFKHTSGAIPGTVYNTISGALQVPFRHHTRRRLQHHSNTILAPFQTPLRKWHHWSATASHYLGIRIATFRRCSFWRTFRRMEEVLSASLARFWRWFWQSNETLWRPHCDAVYSDVVQVSFANWNATKRRR